MPYKSWAKKFYPYDASKVTTEREAILHTLRKWEGLKKDSLRMHGGNRMPGDYKPCIKFSDGVICVDCNSCALCKFYMTSDLIDKCINCPLYKLTDMSCGSERSPYDIWVEEDNIRPMLDALRELAKKYT